jgi:hypothetical protein
LNGKSQQNLTHNNNSNSWIIGTFNLSSLL